MQFDGKRALRELEINGASYDYFSLPAAEAAGLSGVARLPYTLKIVLENLIRQQAEGTASSEDVFAVVKWLHGRTSEREIGFKPARVLMPDSSGIPLLGDMAAMRDAMARLKGDPQRLNPLTPGRFRRRSLSNGGRLRQPRRDERATWSSSLRATRSATTSCAGAAGPSSSLRIIPPGNGHLPPDQPRAPRTGRMDSRAAGGRGARLSRFGHRHGQPHAP